jgi:hypothetical protein
VIWIFATAVLLLVVMHPGFRRVMAWLAGGAAAVAAVVLAIVWWRNAHPPVDISDLPVPPAGYVPCSDLPENLRQGANCPPSFDASAAKPCKPAPAAPTPGCVSTSSAPWKEYAVPTGYTLDCAPGQSPAKNNLTEMQSCYDPKDPAQLAEHLKGCSHQPGEPAYLAKDRIVADVRNIPCSPLDKFDGAQP